MYWQSKIILNRNIIKRYFVGSEISSTDMKTINFYNNTCKLFLVYQLIHFYFWRKSLFLKISKTLVMAFFLPTWTRLLSNHDGNYVGICRMPLWIKRVVFKASLKLEHLFPSINHKKTLFFIYLYFFMFAYLFIELFHSHWLIVCSSCLTLCFWHVIFMFKLNKATYRLQSLLIFKSLYYKNFFGRVFGELRLIKYFQTY